MCRGRGSVSRRRYLTSAAAAPLVGVAGCLGFFRGPLQVTRTERIGEGRTVRVEVTVENTGEEARYADLIVELSHTEARGSISRERTLLLAPEAARTITVVFQPMFLGENSAGQPSDGEFRFDTSFENVEVVEDYPGLVEPSERPAIAGGSAWATTRYDAGATAHNPATTAPRSRPATAWTSAPPFELTFSPKGPVVADGTVYAGRPVRAVSVVDGTEQWAKERAARTGSLALGEEEVVFGTREDVRALDRDSGTVRWTVSGAGGGATTVADGRVYTTAGGLSTVEAVSGEVVWSADTTGSLLGPPPVADGVVLAGGEPLTAFDVADGTVRWTASDLGRVVAAAVAYETVFALTGDHLVALDLAEGRPRWVAEGPFREEQIAVGNGAVYLQIDRRYRSVAVDAATGETEWVCRETDGVLGPPSATDGALVVQSERNTLYGIDTATGEVRWSRGMSMGRPGTVAVADGVCYVTGSRGQLHALEPPE